MRRSKELSEMVGSRDRWNRMSGGIVVLVVAGSKTLCQVAGRIN